MKKAADRKSLSIAVLLIISIFAVWYGYRNPRHSWDTIPYVALVLSLDGMPRTG